MKILVVIPTLWDGGAQRVVSMLTKEWSKSHRVTLVLFDASGRVYDCGGQIVDLRVPASDHPLRKICNVWRRALRLRCLLQKECPDRVISFLETANFPTIVAATLAGYLNRLYISVQDDPASFFVVHRALIPWLYRFPSGVIGCSEGVKRGLKLMRVKNKRISFIPNPIVYTDREVVEQKSASPLPNRFILGVGRLSWQKGFDRLLRAFRGLGRSDLHLVILGEGEERPTLLNLARKLGIKKYVHFPGYVSDVETWYRHAACFVLSSHHEGWPMVLMEAMENGCPAVSFDCKYGPSEIIQEGENGLLVSEGDIEGLMKAIARVLNDEALRRNLVVKGRERAKMFDVREIAARWLA